MNNLNNILDANPVGIITKSIYIIKNDINDKVYIGQSIDPKSRFKKHCNYINTSNSLIGKAIKEYGKEHFWLEILEKDIENYNEREIFWIDKYNSIYPNGYNILPGGDKPPIYHGENHPSCVISDELVKQIMNDLMHTKLSLNDIAKKYNISKKSVLRINHGDQRNNPKLSYPLRKIPSPSGILTEEQVDEIIYLLQYTYLFHGTIGRRYGVGDHAISRINKGTSHHRDNIVYPIRNWKSCGICNVTYDEVTKIIQLLSETNISMSDIGRIFNVTSLFIRNINNGIGKKYNRPEVIYPIREYYNKFHFIRNSDEACND